MPAFYFGGGGGGGPEDLNGNNVFLGEGAPSPTLGVHGDVYIDLDSSSIYKRESGEGQRTVTGPLIGTANFAGGSLPLAFSPGVPSNEFGEDGTYVLDVSAALSGGGGAILLYGPKSAGAWNPTPTPVKAVNTTAALDTVNAGDYFYTGSSVEGFSFASLYGPAVVTVTTSWDGPFSLTSGIGEGLVTTSMVGQPLGVASLDGSGLVPSSQVPPLAITSVSVVDDIEDLDGSYQVGDVVIVTSESTCFIFDGDEWVELITPPDTVLSVNGEIGAVTLSAGDVGAAPASHTHGPSDLTVPLYPTGGYSPDLRYPTGPYASASSNTNAVGLGTTSGGPTLTLVPWIVTDPITITELGLNIRTAIAGTSVVVGIYAHSNGLPNGTRLVQATLDVTATGLRTATGLSVTLAPGIYWFATLCPQLGTVGRVDGINTLGGTATLLSYSPPGVSFVKASSTNTTGGNSAPCAWDATNTYRATLGTDLPDLSSSLIASSFSAGPLAPTGWFKVA